MYTCRNCGNVISREEYEQHSICYWCQKDDKLLSDWRDKPSLGEGKVVYGQVGYATAIIEIEGGLVEIDFPAAIDEFKRHQGKLEWPNQGDTS